MTHTAIHDGEKNLNEKPVTTVIGHARTRGGARLNSLSQGEGLRKGNTARGTPQRAGRTPQSGERAVRPVRAHAYPGAIARAHARAARELFRLYLIQFLCHTLHSLHSTITHIHRPLHVFCLFPFGCVQIREVSSRPPPPRDLPGPSTYAPHRSSFAMYA